MNILIDTEVFYPENFHVNDFAKTLVERGHHVKVMTRQPAYPAGYVYPGYKNDKHTVEKWGEVEIHRFDIIEGYRDSKIKKVRNYFHYVKRGNAIIEGLLDGIDLIVVYQTGPLSVALPAIHAKKKFGIPVIVWTFDIWPDTVYMYGFPKFFPISTVVDNIIKTVYGNADAVMVSSRRFADTIHQYIPDADISYAPNWQIPTEGKTTSLVFDKSKINFVFTGNVSKAQNLGNTIRGFAKANIENAILNIVGDGSTLAQEKAIAKELGCKNVRFHGRIPYNEVEDVLDVCDYLVLPLTPNSGIDKTEPFKLQSYLKSGKPILGIIRGAGQEIIEENEIGVCCDPLDIDDIARGFQKMLELSEHDKQRIEVSSKKLLETRFNKDVILDTIEELAHKVCKSRFS